MTKRKLLVRTFIESESSLILQANEKHVQKKIIILMVKEV